MLCLLDVHCYKSCLNQYFFVSFFQEKYINSLVCLIAVEVTGPQLTLVPLCVFMQNSMNLPPDKARLLRQYDNEKKWELICDQVRQYILSFSYLLHSPSQSNNSHWGLKQQTIFSKNLYICVHRRKNKRRYRFGTT